MYTSELKNSVAQSYGDGNSLRECAILHNISKRSIWLFLKELGIKTRSAREGLVFRSKQGKGVGENHPNWKGGKRFDVRGYITLCLVDSSGRSFEIYEHRCIAEKALGRKLKRNEIVHHINGIKSDNRNCNLLVCDTSYHNWLDHKMAALYQKEHFNNI